MKKLMLLILIALTTTSILSAGSSPDVGWKPLKKEVEKVANENRLLRSQLMTAEQRIGKMVLYIYELEKERDSQRQGTKYLIERLSKVKNVEDVENILIDIGVKKNANN